MPGVVGGRFIAGELASRVLKKTFDNMTLQQMEQTFNEFLVNPEFARMMMAGVGDQASPQTARRVASRVRTHLLATGIITEDNLTEEPR